MYVVNVFFKFYIYSHHFFFKTQIVLDEFSLDVEEVEEANEVKKEEEEEDVVLVAVVPRMLPIVRKNICTYTRILTVFF